jgi:crotonobetaine/carnitine-CoA ligase
MTVPRAHGPRRSDGVDFLGNLTVGDVIRRNAIVAGEREFLVCEDDRGVTRAITYAELDALTDAVAHSLRDHGLKGGDRVVLMMRSSVESVVAMLGCAKVGLVSVPINTASVGPELQHIFGLVRPTALVTDAEFVSVISEIALKSGSIRFGVVVGEVHATPTDTPALTWVAWASLAADRVGGIDASVDAGDLLQLVMTSGTTDRPKAVMHTHANRLRSASRIAMCFRLRPDDRNLSAFPIFHVHCLDVTIFASLISASTAILLESFNGGRYWTQVQRHRATTIGLLPTVIRALLAKPRGSDERSHRVRLATYGMQPTRDELDQFCERFGVGLLTTGWGMTEAATNVLQTRLEEEARFPSVGVPMIDRVVALVDERGRPVPIGTVGEIAVQGIAGRTVMQGYFRDRIATRSVLRNGWLYSGDLAWRDTDGYFYFAGRAKDMIKRSGENIGAEEVEAVLATHPAVAEAAVIGVPDEFRDEAVKAFIVLQPGESLDIATLQEYCGDKLAKFKIPTVVAFVNDLPRSLIGKVDKRVLRDRGYDEDPSTASHEGIKNS